MGASGWAQRIRIELDAKVVVNWVSSQVRSNAAHSSLIADYRILVSQFLRVQIKHCYIEANQCADKLTKFRAKLEQDFVIYDSPPSEINLLLFFDLFGMFLNFPFE